jgi:hypothetical protein
MCVFQSFQKFTKIIPLVLFFHEAPGSTRGWPVGHQRAPDHRPARPRRWPRHHVVWVPLCPTLPSLPPRLFSLPKKSTPSSSHSRFCSRAPDFFDLFAQPRFLSEIWHICSSVCDSSTHPSRISFGWVYLEYFAAVGNMFSELACLFQVVETSFDAWLVL